MSERASDLILIGAAFFALGWMLACGFCVMIFAREKR